MNLPFHPSNTSPHILHQTGSTWAAEGNYFGRGEVRIPSSRVHPSNTSSCILHQTGSALAVEGNLFGSGLSWALYFWVFLALTLLSPDKPSPPPPNPWGNWLFTIFYSSWNKGIVNFYINFYLFIFYTSSQNSYWLPLLPKPFCYWLYSWA